MSSVTSISEPHETPGPPDLHGNGHDAHLAHHFDTPEQQIASGKLGMWVFLATEILMFGGLFCAYSVYRHNHPDVFEYAHQWLNKTLGAVNTIVLITSSLTMAWGVRLAQLGKQRGLIVCLVLTIVGGYGFMAIKSVEYKTKWVHSLGVGKANMYRPGPTDSKDKESIPGGGSPAIGKPEHSEGAAPAGEGHNSEAQTKKTDAEAHKTDAETHRTDAESHKPDSPKAATVAPTNPEYSDPHTGTADEAKVRPTALAPAGLAPKVVEELRHRELTTEELEEEYLPLTELDKKRTYTFFQIYFLMTGLHGLHVLVGMALIFWILVKAVPKSARRGVKLAGLGSIGFFLVYVGILIDHPFTWILGAVLLALAVFGSPLLRMLTGAKPVPAAGAGDFGPNYFAPVDIVGLYWHLVDLIWIFLFPLLYLIR